MKTFINKIKNFFKSSDTKFMEEIELGSKLNVKFYDDNGNVEYDFNAKVIEIDKQKNKCTIQYTDGSTESNYITGWVSIKQNGWKIVK